MPASRLIHIAERGAALNFSHYLPLLGFVSPIVIFGYGFVIPRSCIAGVNEPTTGFAGGIVGACVNYVLGLRSVG